jgi:hypothetical protein
MLRHSLSICRPRNLSRSLAAGTTSTSWSARADDKPSVARVQFSPPGDASLVDVPHELLRVEKFDDDKRILILHFTNKGEPKLPKSFSLVVRKKSGVLTVGGKRIKGSFDWLEEIP